MATFSDARCPRCGRRYGWSTPERPPCPGCGYVVEPADLEADAAEMDKFRATLLGRKNLRGE